MMTRLKAWSEIFRGGVFLVLVSVGVPLLLTHAVRVALITGRPWVA